MGKCSVTIPWKIVFAGIDHIAVANWLCEQLLKFSVIAAESM